MIKKAQWLIIALFMTGCVKTKLEGHYSVLEGKWRWVSAYEEKTSLTTGFTTPSTVYADQYPNDYYFEFDRKGYVYFFKDDERVDKYRTRVHHITENCNVFDNCLQIVIRLNNKSDQSVLFEASTDSLQCLTDKTHLPLKWHEDSEYSYTYSYKFVKVN